MIDLKINENLSSFNNTLDTITNVGTVCSEGLKEFQDSLFIESSYKNPLTNLQQNINSNISKMITDVSQLRVSNESSINTLNVINNELNIISNNVSSAFSFSSEGIDSIKASVVTSNFSLCSDTSKLIQGTLSRLSGTITQLQRSAAAVISQAQQDIISVVQKPLTTIIKVLPKINIPIKLSIPPQFNSIISNISSISSVINGIATEIGSCKDLLDNIDSTSNIFNLLDNTEFSSINSMLEQSNLNKEIIFEDFNLFKDSHNDYTNILKNFIIIESQNWILSPYIKDNITITLNNASVGLSKIKVELDTLTFYNEDLFIIVNQIEEDINFLKEELVIKTNGVIENITNATYDKYEEIHNTIENNINEIQKESDTILESIINIVNDFQQTKSVENFGTVNLCDNTSFRSVLE